MVNNFLLMLRYSSNIPLYVIIYLIPSLYFMYRIAIEPLNFVVLLFTMVIAMITTIIVSEEVYHQENGTQVHDYLVILASENYLYFIKTTALFAITSMLAFVVFAFNIIVYGSHLALSLQLIYFVLILFFNYFYSYIILYLQNSVKIELIRNVLVISVSIIALLGLMSRSIITYITIIGLMGLFTAVTVVNRRIGDQLRREIK